MNGYKSVEILNKYGSWLILLISGGIMLRCTTTLFAAYIDGEFSNAWIKTKKLLVAGIVGLCVSGFITFVMPYYF